MNKELYIAAVQPEDAKELLSVYAPYVEHTAVSFDYEVPSEEEFRKRISRTLKDYPYLKAQKEGRIVGYAYAGPFVGRAAYGRCAEVSIYVAEDFRGQGAGGALYRALEEILKKLGYLNLEACIGVPEVPDEYLTRNSLEFHSHMGYRLVGEFKKCGYKFGRWYDMAWMEKIIGDHGDNPAPVRKFEGEELYVKDITWGRKKRTDALCK